VRKNRGVINRWTAVFDCK